MSNPLAVVHSSRDDDQLVEPLVLIEGGIGEVEVPLERDRHLSSRPQRPRALLRREHEERKRLRLVLARDERLIDVGMGEQRALDRRRGHILPLGGLEDLFEAAREVQVTLGIDRAAISCVEKAVRINRLAGERLVFMVPLQVCTDPLEATGQTRCLQRRTGFIEPVKDLVDDRGVPKASGAEVLPGLYCCGFHVAPTGMLREIRSCCIAWRSAKPVWASDYVEEDEIGSLVNAELAKIGDEPLRKALTSYLVAPRRCLLDWDYGPIHPEFDEPKYPGLVVAAFPASGTGIAWSKHGFGPHYPWGLIGLNQPGFGMDSGWFVSLEAAFRDSMAWEEPAPPGYEVE